MSIENKAKAWKMVINMIISILSDQLHVTQVKLLLFSPLPSANHGMRAGCFYSFQRFHLMQSTMGFELPYLRDFFP